MQLPSLPTLEDAGSRGGWIQCPCAFSSRYWPSSFGDKCSSSLSHQQDMQMAGVVVGQSQTVMAAVRVLERQQGSAVGAALQNGGAAAPVGADSD